MRDQRRLLTRLFLQRFLDNDLISPESDRHEALIVVCAALVSVGLFVTVLLAMKYQLLTFMSPGLAAILSLDDRFLYIGGSMIVMALVAVASWDALSLDARDASILGPLPIPHGAIVRAKLAAVGLFALGFITALNLVPTVLRPLMLPSRLPFTMSSIATLVIAHALTTIVAGVFGFALVLALREVLRVMLGMARFGRVSTLVQATLVVGLTMALLLLPGQYAGVATRWFAPAPELSAALDDARPRPRPPRDARAGARPGTRARNEVTGDAARRALLVGSGPGPVEAPLVTPFVVPPLWFVGLHEAIVGESIAGLPREDLPAWMLGGDQPALALYRSEQPLFRQLARLSLVAFAIVFVVAVGAYAWNSRKLPAPAAGGRQIGLGRVGLRRRLRAAASGMLRRTIVRGPLRQAGFFFTLHALSRSVPHRLAMATAIAVGLAAATVSMRSADVPPAEVPELTVTEMEALAAAGPLLSPYVDVGTMPIPWLALQTVIVTALIVGFRHAVRVPAELRANWMFHLAWSGDERPFLSGVKRAAIVVFIVPAIGALTIWQFFGLGFDPRTALVHALCGLLLALSILEGLLLGWRKLPFASSYIPTSVLKSLVPIYVVTFLLATYAFAWIERLALTSPIGSAVLIVFLATVFAGLRWTDVWQRRTRIEIELDELPAPATQRLNLSG